MRKNCVQAVEAWWYKYEDEYPQTWVGFAQATLPAFFTWGFLRNFPTFLHMFWTGLSATLVSFFTVVLPRLPTTSTPPTITTTIYINKRKEKENSRL